MLKTVTNSKFKQNSWKYREFEDKAGYLAETTLGDEIFIPTSENYKPKFDLTDSYDVSNSRVFQMPSGRKSISHNKVKGSNQLMALIHLVVPGVEINQENLVFYGVSLEFERIVHADDYTHVYLWVVFSNPTGYVALLYGKTVFVVNWSNNLDCVRLHDFQMMQNYIINDSDAIKMLEEYDKLAKANSVEEQLINNSCYNAPQIRAKLEQLESNEDMVFYPHYFKCRNLAYYYTKENFKKVAS